ncbi:MAG: hypothetical protein IK118_05310 [Clostridia bacterium]|nr:hypothetical protein [Clostridia bacterium]MBR5427746.1 hypothetical protein [Clostridia bacterium]
MSGFERFMKSNKQPRLNVFYTATRSLLDENGEPLEWEIKPLTTREAEAIRLDCTSSVRTEHGMQTVLSGDFVPKLCAAAVVYPDLKDAALQDSYGVYTPQDLLMEILDSPGDFNALAGFVREQSGLDVSAAQLSEEAKN